MSHRRKGTQSFGENEKNLYFERKIAPWQKFTGYNASQFAYYRLFSHLGKVL